MRVCSTERVLISSPESKLPLPPGDEAIPAAADSCSPPGRPAARGGVKKKKKKYTESGGAAGSFHTGSLDPPSGCHCRRCRRCRNNNSPLETRRGFGAVGHTRLPAGWLARLCVAFYTRTLNRTHAHTLSTHSGSDSLRGCAAAPALRACSSAPQRCMGNGRARVHIRTHTHTQVTESYIQPNIGFFFFFRIQREYNMLELR